MIALASYFKRRLAEASSWIAIGSGIAAASALPSPWSYVFVAVSVIGVLVPDRQHQPEA